MGRYPFIILCLLGGAKETDLIYEGIATAGHASSDCRPWRRKETDLIYEGIATSSFFRFFNNMVERN
jgi:hypothetical protein